MFNWIDRIFHWGIDHVGGTVVGWVRDLIHGVWGFLSSIFGHVTDSWQEMWTAGHWLWRMAIDFCHAVWFRFYHLLRIFIPELTAFFLRLIDRAERFIHFVLRWVAGRIEYVIKKIEHEIAWALRWVNFHIWLPLKRDFLSAWKWITTDGKLLVFYITHPENLVELIWGHILAKLERDAWLLGKSLGRFFLSLVTHNLKRFAILLEDIIMALI